MLANGITYILFNIFWFWIFSGMFFSEIFGGPFDPALPSALNNSQDLGAIISRALYF